MIDLKHEARNFAPMDVRGLQDKEDDFNEDIRWSYSLYNKALSFIKKGYDDMARQNLKKALGLNSDFYPARMLLGVCLFANGDRVGAMRMFNMIRDIQYKKLAMSYYDYLTEEVDKPISQSGTRLILRDLYRAAVGSQRNVTDVTRPQPVSSEEEPSPREQNPEPASTGTELIKELKKGDVRTPQETSSVEGSETGVLEDGVEDTPVTPFTRESVSSEKEKDQNVITSRKNDGVVEEIIRKKMEDAQKAAIRSGTRKKPFSFSSIYSKPVFGGEEPGETEEREEMQDPAPRPEKRDNIIIAVASVFILLFLVILSVSLMSKISENRELRNDLDSIKKLYAEAIVTESPSPTPTQIPEAPDPTPLSTTDPPAEGTPSVTGGQTLDNSENSSGQGSIISGFPDE